MSVWLVSCILGLATPSLGYPITENVTQVLKNPAGGKLIEGSHLPTGPGTDEGMYNEGDIVLPKADDGTIQAAAGNALTNRSMLWPSAAIIYKTSANVGCPNSRQCNTLMEAMNDYHEKSCIRFKEWTGEPSHLEIYFHPNKTVCWATVGRIGQATLPFALGPRDFRYHSLVLHELGHALGFSHEMGRIDRDRWITIYEKNIMPEFKQEFHRRNQTTIDTQGERFDYRSVMMHGEYAFSKNGFPTLRAKTGEIIGPIWRKQGLSASDARRIEKLYRCKGNKQLVSFPYDVVCDFNHHLCGFKNGSSAVWNWRHAGTNDGHVYSSYDQAGVNPGYFISINFHAVSDQDKARGPLGCVRFLYLLQGGGGANLKLLQAVLDKSTQLTYDTRKTLDLWHNDNVTNKWIHVDLPIHIDRPFKLIFNSQFNRGATHSTIALDNVEILYSHCPKDPSHRSGPLPLSASPPANSSAIPVSVHYTNIEPDQNI